MRPLLLLGLLFSPLAPARAADAAIVNVRGEWRDAYDFDRISEYFTGKENTGGHLIRRSHAEVRAGFYFLVHLAHAAPLTDAKFELQIVDSHQPEPKTFTFSAASPAGENVFELGLTGADWPVGGKVHPVAWHLALLDGDGHVLAEQKSFLWENPAK